MTTAILCSFNGPHVTAIDDKEVVVLESGSSSELGNFSPSALDSKRRRLALPCVAAVLSRKEQEDLPQLEHGYTPLHRAT